MIRINLLPPERRKKLKKVKPAEKKAKALPKISFDLKADRVALLAAAVVLAALVAVGGAHLWLKRSQSSLESRSQAARAELVQLNQVVLQLDELKAANQEISRKMNIISEVDRNRYLWPRLLDEISSALPQYTWLETVSEISPFPQLNLRLEGLTMSNLVLGRLMENLDRSPLLEKIELISSVERNEGSFTTQYFIIECACELNQQPVDSTGAMARK